MIILGKYKACMKTPFQLRDNLVHAGATTGLARIETSDVCKNFLAHGELIQCTASFGFPGKSIMSVPCKAQWRSMLSRCVHVELIPAGVSEGCACSIDTSRHVRRLCMLN